MNFKRGDKVKIVDVLCGHQLEVGSVVTISQRNLRAENYEIEPDKRGRVWWLIDGEIEEADFFDGMPNSISADIVEVLERMKKLKLTKPSIKQVYNLIIKNQENEKK